MSGPRQPQPLRLVVGTITSAGIIIIAIGVMLWVMADDTGSVPLVSLVLIGFGVFELIGGAALAAALRRRTEPSGPGGMASPGTGSPGTGSGAGSGTVDSTGTSVTYQPGDRPPGML